MILIYGLFFKNLLFVNDCTSLNIDMKCYQLCMP